MIYVEVLLIAFGISCEIFAWVSTKSASYRQIDYKKYLIFITTAGIWALLPLLLGYYAVHLLNFCGVSFDDADTSLFVSALILACYAVRLLLRGLKNEAVEERRKEYEEFGVVIHESVFVGIRNLLIGFILYVCKISLPQGLVILTLMAILMAILGVLAGYHYGPVFKRKAYLIGGALLALAAVGIYLI